MNQTIKKPEAAKAEKPVAPISEPLADQTAAARLKALEAEAAPLRARVAEIDGDLAGLDGAVDPEDLDAALAARRARAAKKADLRIERELIAERLNPLEIQIAVLRDEVRIEAMRAANDQFETDILEATEAVTAVARKLLTDAETLREQLGVGRANGLRQSVRMRTAFGDLTELLAKTRNAIGGGIRS